MYEIGAVRVCVAREQFERALREANLRQHDTVVTGPDGLAVWYPGFIGTASDLAVFMLGARERFGPYDAEMMARIVDTINDQPQPYMFRFYFPGLELY